jgi:hypothetical protein
MAPTACMCASTLMHGGKYFVFRFTWRGKDAELALGAYPKKTLEEARKAAANAEELVTEGIDPRQERRAAKAIKRPTFREIRSPQLLATLRAIERKGLHETAHRSLTSRRRTSTNPIITH